MATSTTYNFNPDLADHIEEACERCGIDPTDLGGRHVRSIVRSANLMMRYWETLNLQTWNLYSQSQVLVEGTGNFTLPQGGYDIFHATLKRLGRESEMYPISRTDYNALHDKSQKGRPDRYFTDRSGFHSASAASKVFLYLVPENSTDTIEMWYMRTPRDLDVSNLNVDMPISPFWGEAFASGLSFHLSMKYAPERTQTIKDWYLGEGYNSIRNSFPGGCLGSAMRHDRELADSVFRVRTDRITRGPRG